jgi:Domain of unknown function (DUF4124)
MQHIACLLTFLACAALQPAAAQIHKCTDANGKTSFSQTPCAGGTSEKIKGAAPKSPAEMAR